MSSQTARLLRTGAGAVSLLLALFASRSACAEGLDSSVPSPAPPVSAPLGYHVERHVRPWLPITGGVILTVFYGLAVSGAVNGTCAGSRWLFVPVVGPFAAADEPYSPNEPAACDDPEGIQHAAYMWDGIGQLAGVGFLAASLAFPRIEIVPDPTTAPSSRSLSTVQVVPAAGATGASIALRGTF